MITTNRQTHIPNSERRLAEVREGDIVKISLEDDRALWKSYWAIFKGNPGGTDHFMAQEIAQEPTDPDLVVIYKAPRETHLYDKTLGVIISSKDYQQHYIGPRRDEQDYNQKVEELKEAGLWRSR